MHCWVISAYSSSVFPLYSPRGRLFQYALLWKGERKLGKGSVCTYGLIIGAFGVFFPFLLVVLSFFYTCTCTFRGRCVRGREFFFDSDVTFLCFCT